MTGVAIAVAYWRRRTPGRKRGRPGGTTAPCHGRPYEGWKMSKVQGESETNRTAGGGAAQIVNEGHRA